MPVDRLPTMIIRQTAESLDGLWEASITCFCSEIDESGANSTHHLSHKRSQGGTHGRHLH